MTSLRNLLENPLLAEPLRREHVKTRLLGHWGTSPGQNTLYAHLNRLIRERDANVIYLAGPGHGGPAIVASVYPVEGDERIPAHQELASALDRCYERIREIQAQALDDLLRRHETSIRRHLEDMPEVRDWTWSG